jgi:flagellar M-ring protein FliF
MMASLRQQATSFWSHQSNTQRIVLISLLAVAAIIIPVTINWASTPQYAVLYSGLSETDAASVVSKLAENNITYKLQGTGTIMVASDEVYADRLMLASAGIPASSTVGYELFDNNTLGMTEFTQKINYQRALEGELERTIKNLDAVEAARVHIVIPEQTLLADEQQSPTASVTIKVKSGKTLDAGQVRAITHLVASSVEGLQPDAIVIVDTQGNMLASGDTSNNSTGSATEVDDHRSAEVGAAKSIEQKVQNMLDSVLGPNNSVVQASVTMDWSQRSTTSQSFSPTEVAVRSSQKVNEAYTTNGSTTGGVPGAASNLPTAIPTTSATNGGNTIYSRSEETTNYEITKTESTEVQSPGVIKRISLSVMVDGVDDETQMASIKSAVAAAAGIDDTRGDVLSVESLSFDRTYSETEAADLAKSEQTDLYYRIGEAVLAGLVVLILLWYITHLFRNLRLASSEQWTPVMRPVSEAALPANMSAMVGSPTMLPTGQTAPKEMPIMEHPEPEIPEPTPVPAPKFELPTRPAGPTPEDEQMQRVMARITEENPATIADILQIWLNEDEGRHG